MIFINACSYENYYVWQQEVLITNFRKFGISANMHVLVWYIRTVDLGNWKQLQSKYPEVKFFFYEDLGVDTSIYVPQLRPNILKRHFKKYAKQFKNKVFFYHDVDIIFNYLPDFETLIKDNICWQSNTSSYLDYSYLYNKEQVGNIPNNEAIKKLAEIGGVSVETIKSYDGNTGGAQYILKNIDYKFWQEVEHSCLAIRKSLAYMVHGSINQRYFNSENEGFQSWCADMWAVNFALWKRGLKTSTTPLLDFSWVHDDVETYQKKPIYHNAGAKLDQDHVFVKNKYYITSPIGQEITIPNNTASYYYVEAIKAVK